MSKKLIIGIVTIIIIVGVALYIFSKPVSISNSPTVENQSSLTEPATLAEILDVQMTSSIANSGAALKPVATFSPTTPTIYAVLSLKDATPRTQLSYIRYFNNKYVDSRVSHPSLSGMEYFHFDWVLNSGQTRKVGNYNLVFYIDGKKAQSVYYSIK